MDLVIEFSIESDNGEEMSVSATFERVFEYEETRFTHHRFQSWQILDLKTSKQPTRKEYLAIERTAYELASTKRFS